MARLHQREKKVTITQELRMGPHAKMVINTGSEEVEVDLSELAAIDNTPVVLDATALSVSANTHGGRFVILNHTAAQSVVTLPAATGSGTKFSFLVGAVNTNDHVVQVTGTDTLEGIAFMANDTDASVSGFETAADSDTITLNGTTTGGAAIGDRVEVVDMASGKWHVLAHISGTGVEATPFSAAV